MTALIDGDIIAYRSAAASEADPREIALIRTDIMIMNILDKEPNYKLFLTGSETKYPFTQKPNFRNIINPEYKANRKQPAPKHLDECRKYLIDEYKAIVTEGYEADDALGFNQTNETTIYTIDKDLQQIEGCHFNFIRKEYFEVTKLDGLKYVYKQALIGDSSDNIKGIDKIGKVKASKIIDPLVDEQEMFITVKELYSDDIRFFVNMNCLWVWRKEFELYTDREWVKENANT